MSIWSFCVNTGGEARERWRGDVVDMTCQTAYQATNDSFYAYKNCQLCPRRCGVDRASGRRGVCGQTSELMVARAALHGGEEPPISGDQGSGTIFFSGCTLACAFCQNQAISHKGFGKHITTDRLAEIMLELEAQKALNINLVTPCHFAPQVRQAVLQARASGLALPIVCNTGGYELPETIDFLSDVIDVWLTDYKYVLPSISAALSRAPDYDEVASVSLCTMFDALQRAGGICYAPDGRMLRGLIVRHLVLPGCADDSCAVLRRVKAMIGTGCGLSVMRQYTPMPGVSVAGFDLGREVFEEEYNRVLSCANDLEFEYIWWQKSGAASASYIPSFDATGVEVPEAASSASLETKAFGKDK